MIFLWKMNQITDHLKYLDVIFLPEKIPLGKAFPYEFWGILDKNLSAKSSLAVALPSYLIIFIKN